ncbi:oligosaccharyl transferase, archaeosortase A system-associated [Natronorubrum texcoconense]|uniref:dolichyl-phosphooligosaccharide-protein glycotransferase n=1 Tax=Natronorubrum texcoconense TaxID=1095776 RepID=A0A1G8U365_9EURY|nr:oligosaccharyl transferase, archaeosortase A system-associated [Natronorubrum texcoconense]SDJ48197.1 dolichyl-diphosphooligosaccharide--protein glycosyltransferase [Natronorubrum texcoconense]
MSTDTEHVEGESETSPSFLETWTDWYHIPVLGAVMLFMFWTRAQSYENFITDDGTPALAAVDSWYHWRTVEWTSENYPNTMPFEIFTGFPTGRYVGQFGTLFDQIIVTIAMIVGLGDPSTETLYLVSLLTVPAMAALVAIPVFFIGRRLGGTIGGIVAILLLALAPGQFFSRTTAGQLQHHVAEVLFMAFAVLAMMLALRVAEREQPIYELVADRDWDGLREPTLYSVLAGVALILYIWVWPPAVVLIGILAIFFTVQLCLDYVRNVSPDHIAFVGAISLGVTAIGATLLIEEPGTSTTSFSYLQPVSAALVAGGCVFMAWLARQWNAHDIDRRYYPGAIAGLIAVAFVVMWAILPDLFSTIVDNASRRVLPFGGGATDQTISEARQPADFTSHVFNEFGAAFYTMLAGLGLLVARPFLGREYRTEYTLIVVWSLFLISMAATQIRFAYYLVLAVAVVNAVFVADVIRIFDLDIRGGVDTLRGIETYQVIVLIMVVLLLFAPLLPPMAAGNSTTWDRGAHVGPSDEAMTWEEANHWMANNTPEPGNWGDAENADQLDYFGTYEYPDGGDYDYPEGTYGVMSWWDYGHLITTQAERIPHSNPFQQNARSSSAYLTADSEERAELILDSIAAGESPEDHSNEELEGMAEDATHEEMRYVMIDHEMAGAKFSAITQWSGPDYDHYYETSEYQVGGEEQNLPAPNENYYDTTMASLYHDDADGMEHYRLVHENDDYAFVGSMQTGDRLTPHYSMSISEYNDLVAASGGGNEFETGWGEQTEQIAESLAQTRENNMVDQSLGIPMWDADLLSTVKTYERVEGATITGEVDDEENVLADNATVTAEVELETEPGRTFTYEQTADVADDGTFELTVPYATNDELGVDDGYTDSSVEAIDGEYTVTVGEPGEDGFEGQTEVPETAVVQGDTVTVDLEQVELEDPDAGDEEENGDADDENGDADDENGDTDDENGDADDENGDEDDAEGDADGAETEDE